MGKSVVLEMPQTEQGHCHIQYLIRASVKDEEGYLVEK